MILPIYTYGQQILREEAKTVDIDDPQIKALVDNLFETMYKAEGVGLAAPQVGFSLRMFVIDGKDIAENHPECKDFKRVMINPVITNRSTETTSLEEGCLSFPGIHEKVPRSVQIQIEYFDENLIKKEESLNGFNARIVQHECEHLDGRVFIDSISPIRKQLNRSKLNNLVKGNVSCKYKVKTNKL